MKKILPKLLLCSVFLLLFLTNIVPVFAQTVVALPPPPPSAVTPPPPPPPGTPADTTKWINDRDVTFAGKIAARSRDLLNNVILHHQWSFTSGPTGNPFDAIWITIRNIVYAVLGLFILAGAFLLIITRGKSLTVKKFVPRFVLVLILVTLSYSLIAFFYQIGDVIQGFFFKRADGAVIQARDLLDVGFQYGDFNQGLRVQGDQWDENVFVSTLLVKLTAATYYAMFGILIVRKVILWFFIVISPIFPLLLMFANLRNSAKIWAGEFFRWLLYAPLFAILLSGLVAMWRLYIPLDLPGVSCGVDDPIAAPYRYDTAISILLGGPCQKVTLHNSLNSPDSFTQYVVALIMLWMVIIIPFLLLKIFLDYFNNFSFGESNVVKYLAQSSSPILNRYGMSFANGGGGVRPPPGGPSPSSHPAGLAKSLPVAFTHSTLQQTANDFANTMQSTAANSSVATTNANQAAFEQSINQMQANTSAESTQSAENIATAVTNATNQAVTNASEQASSNITNANSATSANLASSNKAFSQNLGQRFGTSAASTFNNNFARSGALNTSSSQNSASSTNLNTASNARKSTSQLGLQAGVQAGVEAGINTSFPSGAIQAGDIQVPEITASLLNLTNLNIPSMKDISRYESAMISSGGAGGHDTHTTQEVNRVFESLNRIAGTSTITSPSERTQLSSLRDRISDQAKKGNNVASSILSASMPAGQAAIPEVNKTQQVSLEDYEEVKKIWEENYRKIDVPAGPDGKPRTRQEWLTQEVKDIPMAIDFLMSGDPTLQKKGKDMVSKILPFLLLGGFSKAEIVAYLKAKLQAAKNILKELGTEEQKGDLVEVETKEQVKPKSMEAEAKMPGDEKPKGQPLPDPSNPAATLEKTSTESKDGSKP